MNQIVEFGKDAIENLEIFLNEKKPESIFFVTGKKSYDSLRRRCRSLMV